ncbi:MAG: ECF transporter S component [Candidatus Bathyarchaeota archaeon]|nr:ECF transporter S component [Candidatus Bathyarchaeota archaeon]
MDNPSNIMQNNTKNPLIIALMGVLTALCLAVQLSPRPPNVEFTSLFTFTFGFLFGPFLGVLFGSFVMFVNGFFSPWGFAGPNLPFQIAGMAIVGLAGGLYKRYVKGYNAAGFCIEVAVLGAFLTELYDLVTNFGVAFSYMIVGMNPSLAVFTALAYGTPFSLVHVFSNIAVFGIMFFPLIGSLNHVLRVENLG